MMIKRGLREKDDAKRNKDVDSNDKKAAAAREKSIALARQHATTLLRGTGTTFSAMSLTVTHSLFARLQPTIVDPFQKGARRTHEHEE